MFTLEALKARHGDCLLLHWGDPDQPHLALIDGGPDRTYRQSLKPRLEQLAGGGDLAIELVMLSHIDDDHINGLIDLGNDIKAGQLAARIKLLWFNSLEGLLDGPLPVQDETAALASMRGVFDGGSHPWDSWTEKVLASVGQGQDLDAIAGDLGLDTAMNWPYDRLVMRGVAPPGADIDGLTLVPVAPAKAAIEALRKVWKEKRRDVATAAYRDRSPYNLSSIVAIAEHAGKSMLLTGDALGSDIIEGLDELGRLDGGRAHFDLLKLPHHGSQNNVEKAFFETITADHYVVSGDLVKFPNPHADAMRWLAEARGDDDYVVHCPYDLQPLRDCFGARLRVPDNGALGVTVTL